jgi:hypothetical protein
MAVAKIILNTKTQRVGTVQIVLCIGIPRYPYCVQLLTYLQYVDAHVTFYMYTVH